jgi:hypothetical protein
VTDLYPRLAQFLGAYFHQDWLIESDSWEGAVDLYLRGAQREDVLGVYDELTLLRSQTSDEEALEQKLFQLGSFYSPVRNGVRPSAWIQGVQKRLITGL